MNFIQSSERVMEIGDTTYYNEPVNLDMVLSIRPMASTAMKNVNGNKVNLYYTISFYSTPESYMNWYYTKKSERNEKYEAILDYIRTNQSNVKI